MQNIDSLLEGINLVPRRRVPKMLTGEQVLAREKVEVETIAREITERKKQFDLIEVRRPSMLILYDERVLKGYSAEKEVKYKAERSKVCVPCFIRFPADQPAWVKLNWGLKEIGSQEETQYEVLLNSANKLQGVEAEQFHYSLRNNLEREVRAVIENYQPIVNLPFSRPASLDAESQDEEPSPEECEYFETREQKWRLIGSLRLTSVRYQFMIDLIKEKQNPEN